jgi:1,4-dihydroxy-2-naphthoyl-CoA hydrolase
MIPLSIDAFTHAQKEMLPAHLGFSVDEISLERIVMSFDVQKHHLAPNGYLHAGSLVTLADTACGYGTIANLPQGAKGFTTIELKSNFFATALNGKVVATATPLHRGRTTQVWDADLMSIEKKTRLALFRCSNLILWPRPT